MMQTGTLISYLEGEAWKALERAMHGAQPLPSAALYAVAEGLRQQYLRHGKDGWRLVEQVVAAAVAAALEGR